MAARKGKEEAGAVEALRGVGGVDLAHSRVNQENPRVRSKCTAKVASLRRCNPACVDPGSTIAPSQYSST
eukprot:348586-Rhodomonas_salina.3